MSAQRNLAYRWLPDDTQESILGADWHQDAISSLRNGLRDVARAHDRPWHVCDQLTLVAWHPDGTIWRPKPDIMVHPEAGPASRDEMRAATDGIPALIVEVASPSTYRSDVNVVAPTRERPEAKGFEYLAWPLPEYLVFDPTASHVPGQVRAWRVAESRVQEWAPDADGRYYSRTLGVSFCPEGFFLRIFDPAGRPVPLDHEKAGVIARLEQERAEAIRQVEQAEQERAEAIRRAEQAEQDNAALQALIERLRGQGGTDPAR
jgi:Uma2 family endonuclease